MIDQYLLVREKPTDWKGQFFQWAEHKEDGYRVTIFKQPNGITAIGKKKRIDLWPFISRNDEIRRKVEDLSIGWYDGELLSLTQDASDVPTAMRTGEIRFVCFCSSATHDFERPVRAPFDGKATEKEMLEYCIRENIEGLILKSGRLGPWYKLKPVRTLDCVVTGWEPGESRLEGLMGSLVVSVLVPGISADHGPLLQSNPERFAGGYFAPEGYYWLEVANVGTGWKDADRVITAEESIGRVLEVTYDCVAAQGRLKFARFTRWRDDKPWEECIWQ